MDHKYKQSPVWGYLVVSHCRLSEWILACLSDMMDTRGIKYWSEPKNKVGFETIDILPIHRKKQFKKNQITTSALWRQHWDIVYVFRYYTFCVKILLIVLWKISETKMLRKSKNDQIIFRYRLLKIFASLCIHVNWFNTSWIQHSNNCAKFALGRNFQQALHSQLLTSQKVWKWMMYHSPQCSQPCLSVSSTP